MFLDEHSQSSRFNVVDTLMTQNLNVDLMRQMQQQFVPLGSQYRGVIDLQQRAESLLAAIASSNNNNMNQEPQPQDTIGQPMQQQTQPNNFSGLEGLEQLQNLNPLQAAATVNQSNVGALQSLGGLQGLQQQFATFQQQLGQGQQQMPQLQQQQTQQQLGQAPQQVQPIHFPTWIGQSNDTTSLGFNPFGLMGTIGEQNNVGPFPATGNMQGAVPQNAFPHQPNTQQNLMLFPQGSAPEQKTQGIDGLNPLFDAKPRPNNKQKKKAQTFPVKLMKAMSEHPNEEAVAWLPDGKSFVILNSDLFCTEVLNHVFRDTKYASFVRKLHRWGFVRLTSGTGTDCFHHPFFHRHRREQASKIFATRRLEKDGNIKRERAVKPPSLHGFEKFIRKKLMAAQKAQKKGTKATRTEKKIVAPSKDNLPQVAETEDVAEEILR